MASVRRNIMSDTSNVVHGVGRELGGFKKFLVRGNVVDLAVGVVIGAAFNNVIQAIVKDLITPLVGLFGFSEGNFATWTVRFGGQDFLVGDVINTLLSFVIVAAVVYFFIVLPVNRLMDRYKPEPKPAPTKDCPECLSSIPENARRCRECGAQLEPPSEAVVAAMRQVAAPSGAEIANQAAKVLSERLNSGGS